MSLKNEETDGHRTVSLRQAFVLTAEELCQSNEITQTLAHLLPVDGNHVVVHPIVHHVAALAGHGLCDFTLMVWENQVHSSTVDVEMVAQVLATHGRTLAMPTGETVAPRTGPTHDMLRLGTLP